MYTPSSLQVTNFPHVLLVNINQFSYRRKESPAMVVCNHLKRNTKIDDVYQLSVIRQEHCPQKA